MPLTSSLPLIEAAARHRRARLAFNVSSLEMLQGVVAAAAGTEIPVLIQFNRAGLDQIGGPRVAVAVTRAVLADVSLPIALHLDHADSLDELEAAVAAGFTSLMIDGSTLPFDEHVRLAQAARALATAAAVPLEAELGHVSGSEAGVTIAAGSLTDPVEAARFVAQTGVDLLAVSVGNVHGKAPAGATLDFERLARIHEAVSVPLVLHGSSGIAADLLLRAVEIGVAKINVGTGVHRAFRDGLRDGLAESDDARAALRMGRSGVQRFVERQLRASYAAGGVEAD